MVDSAIEDAKKYMENYFSSGISETGYEIDEISFYVTDDWKGRTPGMFMVSNSFVDLSNFIFQLSRNKFEIADEFRQIGVCRNEYCRYDASLRLSVKIMTAPFRRFENQAVHFVDICRKSNRTIPLILNSYDCSPDSCSPLIV